MDHIVTDAKLERSPRKYLCVVVQTRSDAQLLNKRGLPVFNPGVEDMHMKIRQLLVTAFLFAGTGVVLAEDDDICAPFKDGLVDDGMLVRNMLKGENFFDVEDHPEILFC